MHDQKTGLPNHSFCLLSVKLRPPSVTQFGNLDLFLVTVAIYALFLIGNLNNAGVFFFLFFISLVFFFLFAKLNHKLRGTNLDGGGGLRTNGQGGGGG
jgi:hypothetical protein